MARRTLMGLAVAGPCLAPIACGMTTWTPELQPASDVPDDDGARRWLKVHTYSGGLYVLESWRVPDGDREIEGSGGRYDADRELISNGRFTIPLDSVALFEANDRDVVSQGAMAGLDIFTGLTGVVTFACLADPKSCFGSCPTFYADAGADRPLAEGFSASFARALEERDVDDIGLSASAGPFSLVMRNEAQETHAVRYVRLLAVDAPEDGQVLQTDDGRLVRALGTVPPRECRSEDGDCLPEVLDVDDVEYAPLTDGEDLARREEVILGFDNVAGPAGLVLAARQSLVTTYVFYQSLAYAGSSAGELLAALERGEPGVRQRVRGPAEALGGIEIHVRTAGGTWSRVGLFDEAGPIASDRHVVRLGDFDNQHVEVKLRMARGSWRLDEARLALLGEDLRPVVLEPDSVTPTSGSAVDASSGGAAPDAPSRGSAHDAPSLGSAPDAPSGGFAPDALARLLDPDAHLVTTRGDAYRIWFTIPDGGTRRLFLDTEGYYYEWMREGWLDEEDPLKAGMLLVRPREALRQMAPAFKEVEPRMERLFWESRFRR